MSEGESPMAWSIQATEQTSKKLIVILLATVIAAVAGAILLRSVWGGLMAIVVMLFATAEYWRPAKFELSETKAKASRGLSVTEMLWVDINTVHLFEGEILLSPFKKDTKLNETRGVRIRTTDENCDVVIARIKEKVKPNVRFVRSLSAS
jgi:hypothetical protein